jgi:ribosome modulation factor
MSDDQRAKLTFQLKGKYERVLAAKKAADKALKDVGKEIKADLGKGGLQDIKDMIRLAEPEGEQELKDAMERRARVMRWLGMDVGHQSDMFADTDRRPITEKAFAEGKKAGLAGETHKNPYHQTNDGHQAWNDGYVEGQGVILARMKPLDAAAAADSLAS